MDFNKLIYKFEINTNFQFFQKVPGYKFIFDKRLLDLCLVIKNLF